MTESGSSEQSKQPERSLLPGEVVAQQSAEKQRAEELVRQQREEKQIALARLKEQKENQTTAKNQIAADRAKRAGRTQQAPKKEKKMEK